MKKILLVFALFFVSLTSCNWNVSSPNFKYEADLTGDVFFTKQNCYNTVSLHSTNLGPDSLGVLQLLSTTKGATNSEEKNKVLNDVDKYFNQFIKSNFTPTTLYTFRAVGYAQAYGIVIFFDKVYTNKQ